MRPIILLGHGSPDPRSAAGLRALARAVTRRLPTTLVEVAFLDHDEPSLTALADLGALAAQWSATRGTAVVVAHAAMSDPDVSTAIATVRATGEPAVAAYVLFPGVLPDRITAAAGDLPCSPPVGASDAAVDIVIDRALDISLAS